MAPTKSQIRHAGFALALFIGLSAGRVEAQTPHGFALNRYEPTPAGENFFLAEHPWYSSTRVFAGGIFIDHAVNPLVLRPTNAPSRTIISGMLTGHVALAASFIDRIGLSLSLPVSFTQIGETTNFLAASYGPAGGPAVGDLRAGVRVRLFGHADRDPFSLHIGAHLWVPTGSRLNNTGDENVRVEPRLTLAGRGGPIRWSFGGAFAVRGDINEQNLAIGNEFRLTAALGVALADDRLTIGPEAYVFSAVRERADGSSTFFAADQWGGEAVLGIHYLVADAVLLGAGGGVGIGRGGGVPAGRALFSVAYAPVSRAAPVSDRDRDGVPDGADACPDTHHGVNPDPARPGCPAGDRDQDGVVDPNDLCVDVPQGEHPDPARLGCPLVDTDGDGFFDPQDQCVNVPAGPNADPARPGCPRGDRDADGVFDDEDQCPDEVMGARPSPTRRGCPALDADHDGILDPPDGPDRCPSEPETFNNVQDDDGCPDGTALAVSSSTGISIVEQVNFRTDSDVIVGARSFAVLDSVVSVLRAMPNITQLDVQGHTDRRGSDEHNLDLSNRRAASVRRYLIAHGIEEGRLVSNGFGASCPARAGRRPADRAANRRVQFVIVTPDQPAGRCTNTPQ